MSETLTILVVFIAKMAIARSLLPKVIIVFILERQLHVQLALTVVYQSDY